MLGIPSCDTPALRPASTLEEGGYRITGFQLGDAADIPRAFQAVYGGDYLNPLVYDAAGFAATVASGSQVSFIARDAEGDFAGHLALVFSAPNPRLVEVAQGIVLPAHRKSGIFRHLMRRAVDFARDELGCQAVFGTALTNHAVSQKVLAQFGFKDVGLEVDYVPERMLVREGAGGPAATLVQYLDFGCDEAALCHLPAAYADWFAGLLDAAGIAVERQVAPSRHLDRKASLSEAKDMPRFDMARLLVRRAGFDFWQIVSAFEASAEFAGRRTLQVLVDLGDAEGAVAVEQLRGWGYACGGLLPGYLEGGRHLAIMYRSLAEPYFDGIRLHAEQAEDILACVMADWKRAQGLDTGSMGAHLALPQDDEADSLAVNDPGLIAEDLDAETGAILRALSQGGLPGSDRNAAGDTV